jgi:hypothetical protein
MGGYHDKFLANLPLLILAAAWTRLSNFRVQGLPDGL